MKGLLFKGVVLSLLVFFTFSCEFKQEEGGGGSGSHTEPVSSSDYNSLSPEGKYYLVSKLTATLYKGIPPGQFFNLQKAEFDMELLSGGNYLEVIKQQISTPLSSDQRDYYFQLAEVNYNYDESIKPPQYIMTLLWVFPLSKDYYDMWMAYFLGNTKLFSPAVEVESSSYMEVHKVFERLFRMISEDESIREIVYQHMISQENWRRFRSPEDNTREMMEIFLRRFIDEEVPKAALACKNWSLTGQDQGYQLVIDFNENTEPQDILDTTVTTCWDFYRAIADHPNLIPTVIAEIVDHLFSGLSEEEKKVIVDEVVAKNPQTFRDIFNILIFSKAYLLNNERPLKWEEAFLGTASRLGFKPSENFFRFVNRPQSWGSGSIQKLASMKQPPLYEKLGRTPTPPLDALSFAYYHKSVRENLMINRAWNADDDGWGEDLYDVLFIEDDFVNYVFVTALGRKATQEELDTFRDIFQRKNYQDKHRWQKAMLILDYISRLPEFYMLRPSK